MMRNIKIAPDTYLKRQGELLLIFNVHTDDLFKVSGDAALMLEVINENNLSHMRLTDEDLVRKLAEKSENFRVNPDPIGIVREALSFFHRKSLVVYDA